MSYHLEGRLLEVCDCRVMCPCWIGEDPDNGTCKGMMAWRIDRGEVEGVDVSGRTIAAMANIPGNVLAGNWSAALYVDENASKPQEAALLKVFTGEAGGPVADLARLIGRVVSVERAPIRFDVDGGKGTLQIGAAGYAELEPYVSAAGRTTTLSDTIFSTVPGAPVFVGKARHYRAKNDELGVDVDLKGHNALQSTFVFDA